MLKNKFRLLLPPGVFNKSDKLRLTGQHKLQLWVKIFSVCPSVRLVINDPHIALSSTTFL